MSIVALQVEVPIASFRQSHAREYMQTYPVPPPATVDLLQKSHKKGIKRLA